MDDTKRFSREHLYVETLFGRRAHFPDIRSSQLNLRSFQERAAHKGLIQGSAAGQAVKVEMLGVLDWACRDLIVHTSRTKRSSDFIALLETVDRLYGPKPGVAIKPTLLVLDNGPIHTSKATRAALQQRAHWLTVEWLPKYAPELNDIEEVWRDLKRHHLAHQTFTGPQHLDQAIHAAVMTLNLERNRHPLPNHRIAA